MEDSSITEVSKWRLGRGDMAYLVGIQIRAEDSVGFAKEFEGWTKPLFMDLGATSARLSQTIYGSDQAGMLLAAATFDSIQTAAECEKNMNADSRVKDTMAKVGAQRIGRSLLVVRSERGELAGEYGSGLMISSSSQPTEDEVQKMADDSWAIMGDHVNGIRQGQMIAAGERTGMWVAGTYTDNLDELMAGSAKLFADPNTQQNMARFGNQLVSRSIFRTLV